MATTTTCGGAQISLTSTASGISLADANIPAEGSCQILVPVHSAVAGTYTDSVSARALVTGPAGANAQPASATLTVTAPSGGGGALGWWDTLLAAGLLLAGRRRGARNLG